MKMAVSHWYPTDRPGPERTKAKSLLGWDSSERESHSLRCFIHGLASRQEGSIFPGGKWACEHQGGTDFLEATQADLSTLPLLTEGALSGWQG